METHAATWTQELRLLRLPDVIRRVGLSRSMVYQLVAAGRFPAPVRLTSRATAWRSDAVQAWIVERGTQHTAPPTRTRRVPRNAGS
jgi:prophage regulatory protein